MNFPSQYHQLDSDPLLESVRTSTGTAMVRLPFGGECRIFARYADVRAVLADSRFSRAAAVGRDEPRARLAAAFPGELISMDPPDHTRVRSLVAKAFTARRIERQRSAARRTAEELVDRMVRIGPPADLIRHVASPLPIAVVSELLGVPTDQREKLYVWSNAFFSSAEADAELLATYAGHMAGFAAELIELRRAQPANDLISALVVARDEGERLSGKELLALVLGLIVAGHESTSTQIANCVYTLLTHSGTWTALAEDPSLIPGAVEELLRFIPLGAAGLSPRYATEDIHLGNVTIHAGEPVIAVNDSANMDEEAFDRPRELNLQRPFNHHLAFGHGVHYCLGAPLARMELQVALETLTSRLPELGLTEHPNQLTWTPPVLLRGLTTLPVTW